MFVYYIKCEWDSLEITWGLIYYFFILCASGSQTSVFIRIIWRGLFHTDCPPRPPPLVSAPVGQGEAEEFVFLMDSQVMLMFKNHNELR